MRRPQPPFMEYGFYFQGMSGYDAYRFFIIRLIEKLNAIPYSIIYSENPTLENPNEKGIGNAKLMNIELQVSDQLTLVDLMNDPGKKISRVVFKKCTNVISGACEYAVITPHTVERSANDSCCVALWIEGESFSIAGRTTSRKQNKTATKNQKMIAARALNCFKLLVDQLSPSYAAITFEYGLETPAKLKQNQDSYGFFDFYLSDNDFSHGSIQQLQNLYPDCYFETLSHGSLIISSSVFRKSKIDTQVENWRYDLSKDAAKLITRFLK